MRLDKKEFYKGFDDIFGPASELTEAKNNLVPFIDPREAMQQTPNQSAIYKSNGVKKATAADPIRDPKDILRIQKYFKDRDEFRNYALFTLAISSMLRASDLLALTFGDIWDPETADHIQKADIRDYILVKEKKTGKKNKIYINEKCRDALDLYFGWLYAERDITWLTEDMPVFFSDTSFEKDPENPKAISIQMFDKILKRAGKDLGLEEHLSTHSLRKTMVYHTIKNSNYDQYTLYLLQRMLNHSDVRTTFRYCGLEEESIKKIREDIGKMLSR